MPSGLYRQHPSRIGIHRNCIDVYDIEDAFGLVQRVLCWPAFCNRGKVGLRIYAGHCGQNANQLLSHCLRLPLHTVCAYPYPALPFPCHALPYTLPCPDLPRFATHRRSITLPRLATHRRSITQPHLLGLPYPYLPSAAAG